MAVFLLNKHQPLFKRNQSGVFTGRVSAESVNVVSLIIVVVSGTAITVSVFTSVVSAESLHPVIATAENNTRLTNTIDANFVFLLSMLFLVKTKIYDNYFNLNKKLCLRVV